MVAIIDLDSEVRGDTVIYDLTLSRTGASAGWMTGGTIRFMAKLRTKDADIDAIFTKSTPADGIVWTNQSSVTPTATVTIESADWPASLLGKDKPDVVYEVEIEESNGRRETVQRGKLPILADVIRGA